jgi:hypothetical protein
MSERGIDRERVREEHLAEANPMAHWAYLLAILGGGLVAMLALIGWLGAAGT